MVLDQVRHAAHARGDHWHRRGHRFEHAHGTVILQRGEHEQRSVAQVLLELLATGEAAEAAPRTRGEKLLKLLPIRIVLREAAEEHHGKFLPGRQRIERADAARSVPNADRFLPHSRRWPHKTSWCCLWLGPPPASSLSTPGDVCPGVVLAAPCRSSFRSPARSHAPHPRRAASETVVDIAPGVFPAPGGPGPTWRFAPRWIQSQIHNVPEHFPPPGQTPARSQSPSAPAPVVETGPVPSLPPAREKAAGSSWPRETLNKDAF